jgi:hypothetical protein
LRLDLQSAAEHGDHRVVAVNRCRGIKFLPGEVVKSVLLAPEQQLQVLLDVVGLDSGLLSLIAIAKVAAEEFDARHVDLHLLVRPGNGVEVPGALDTAFNDLAISEQEDTGTGGRRRAIGSGQLEDQE